MLRNWGKGTTRRLHGPLVIERTHGDDDNRRRLDGNARLSRHYLEGGPVQYELVDHDRLVQYILKYFGLVLTLRNRSTRNPRTDPFNGSILLHQANLHDTYAVRHLYHNDGGKKADVRSTRRGKDRPHGD